MGQEITEESRAGTELARNKEVARRYFEELVNERRLDLLEEIVAEDAADETRVGPGGRGTREDFREHALWLFENVGDARTTITDVVAEGDRVVVFWRLEGVQLGEFFGVPATGRPFSGASISTLTIRDGKVVRYHVLPDRLGVVRQLEGTA